MARQDESTGNAATRFRVRLVAIRYLARDTHLYELQRLDGRALPAAAAGAHIDVDLAPNLVRQYSVVIGVVPPDRYAIAVKRDPKSRGGSAYIHDRLRVGQELEIGSPRNNFALDETAVHTTLIAGGIGITPIWSMVTRLRALGRDWSLHYACRSREDAAFLESLEKMPEVALHFDAENDGRCLDLEAVVTAAPAVAHLYCCGPSPMLKAFSAATAGRVPDRVHLEYFALEPAAPIGGFQLRLSRSGLELVVPPGKTILDVLLDAGLKVPFSCSQGICGACETGVIEGIPDHRDTILTAEERGANKTIMVCCSGCRSDALVLDL